MYTRIVVALATILFRVSLFANEPCSIYALSNEREQHEYLTKAVRDNRPDDIRKAVASGASIDASNHSGETVLMFAVLQAELDIIKLLVELGADVNAQDFKGHSPLIKVATIGRLSVMDFLIEQGADISLTTIYGETAITIAKETIGERRIANLLTKHQNNASVEAFLSKTGFTAVAQPDNLDQVDHSKLNNWTVDYEKIRKLIKKLPYYINQDFMDLISKIEKEGSGQGKKFFGSSNKLKVGSPIYFSHLRYRYVAVWRVVDKQERLIEVKYVGTREKAPY